MTRVWERIPFSGCRVLGVKGAIYNSFSLREKIEEGEVRNMKAEDVRGRLWKFIGELSDDSNILCCECNNATPLSDWREGDVYCEDCGDHAALICPACEERHDHVFCKPFQIITPPHEDSLPTLES